MWRIRITADLMRKEWLPPESDPFFASRQMAAGFIPYVDATIDAAGRAILADLGQQPPDDWFVANPTAIEAARRATLDLCEETIESFLDSLNGEIQKVRNEIAESVTEGETARSLVNRIARWMKPEARWRARRIANTESARAFNTGQVAATETLDFVAGFRWVLDGDACPLCHKVQRLCPVIPKGGTFAVNGKRASYKNVKFPPLHPNCRCTLVPIFDDEVPSEWPKTVLPDEGADYVKPDAQDIETAEEGGYESVVIGNAR